MPAGIHDGRITTVGLLLEAQAALIDVLGSELEARCDLPLTWYEVLLRLAKAPDERLRMSDLAGAVTLSTSGLTRLVDRMEAAGLVARRPCPADRRGSYATLTDAGRRRLHDATPIHLASVDRHLRAHLDVDELDAMSAALRKLRDALRSPGGPATC